MWVAGGVAMVLTAAVLVAAALLEGDRWSVRPRRTGTVTAEELREAHLPIAWRGYDRGHVDALLARAATTLDQVQRYGAVVEPNDTRTDAVDDRPPAGPPSFLADAVSDAPGPEPEPAEPADPGARREPRDDLASGSGEELEDRGGDDARGLDR